MDKGNCNKCGRKIQKTTFDKCMYCGHILDNDQKFTDEEKHALEDDRKQREDERTRLKQKSDNSSDSPFSGGGDFNISGGCDGGGE